MMGSLYTASKNMYIYPPFVVSRADADDINGKVHACI